MFKNGKDQFKKIYIKYGYTDLRYGINGLAAIITSDYDLDPLEEGVLFLFCGRGSDRIKGLVYDGDGFILLTKRLSSGRFCWPRSKDDMKLMTGEQYDLLMNGYTIESTIKKSDIKYVV